MEKCWFKKFLVTLSTCRPEYFNALKGSGVCSTKIEVNLSNFDSKLNFLYKDNNKLILGEHLWSPKRWLEINNIHPTKLFSSLCAFNPLGMWTASFSLGNFLSPTLSGISVDSYGFRTTTVGFFVIFLLNIIVGCLELSYNLSMNRNIPKVEYEPLK